jgi:hypothetical protein
MYAQVALDGDDLLERWTQFRSRPDRPAVAVPRVPDPGGCRGRNNSVAWATGGRP